MNHLDWVSLHFLEKAEVGSLQMPALLTPANDRVASLMTGRATWVSLKGPVGLCARWSSRARWDQGTKGKVELTAHI